MLTHCGDDGVAFPFRAPVRLRAWVTQCQLYKDGVESPATVHVQVRFVGQFIIDLDPASSGFDVEPELPSWSATTSK